MSVTAREGRSRLQNSVTQAVLGQDLAGSETDDADLDVAAGPPPEQWARRGRSVGVMLVTSAAQDAQDSPVSRNGSIAISRRSRYSITSGLDREFSSPQGSETFGGGQRRLSHKMSDRFLQRYIGPGAGAGSRSGREGSPLTSAVPEDLPEGDGEGGWLAPESQATLVDKLSWARRFSTGPGTGAAAAGAGSRRGSRRFSQAVGGIPGLTASLTVSFNRRESQSQTVTGGTLPSRSMDASLLRRRSGTGVVPGPGSGSSPNAAAAANAAAYAAAGIVNPLLAAVGTRGGPGGPHGAEGGTNPAPPPPQQQQHHHQELPAVAKASPAPPASSVSSSIQEEPAVESPPKDSRATTPSSSPPPRRPLRPLQAPRRPPPSIALSSAQALSTATPQITLSEGTASTSEAASSPPSLPAPDASAAPATTAPAPPAPSRPPQDGVVPVALALQLRRTETTVKGPTLMGDRVVVRAETLKPQEPGPETHRLRKALSRMRSFLRGDPGGPVALPGAGAMQRKASSGAAPGAMQHGR